jgi:hypothetical protein
MKQEDIIKMCKCKCGNNITYDNKTGLCYYCYNKLYNEEIVKIRGKIFLQLK